MSQPLTLDLAQRARNVELADTMEKVTHIQPDHGASVLLWRRELPPDLDFNGLAEELFAQTENRTLYFFDLLEVDITPKHQSAQRFILDDMQRFKYAHSADLRVIRPDSYDNNRDIDVHDFHPDGGKPGQRKKSQYRVCCCYNIPTTEGVIYAPDRQIIHFRPGDVWAQALTNMKADPFYHRAPRITWEDPFRLFLVCDCYN